MSDATKPLQADFGFSQLLAPSPDQNLLLTASERWRDCHRQWLELMEQSPQARASITRLLKDHWDLDGNRVGLGFFATGNRPEHFVSLTHACAFVLQQPAIEVSLDARCAVTGLAREHRLFGKPPSELLEQLKNLNPEHLLNHDWERWWNGRAPGTAVSRRALAIQLYRQHFEASSQVAHAQRTLTAEQMKSLLTLIDAPSDSTLVDAPPMTIKQLALRFADSRRVELPGVLLISTEQPAAQLLYLPEQQPAWRHFRHRHEVENWLTTHPHNTAGMPPLDGISLEYTRIVTTPLAVDAEQLIARVSVAWMNSIRQGNGSDIAEHGATALDAADRLDRQRRQEAVFAEPAEWPADTLSEEETGDSVPQFGLLTPDIALDTRQSALAYHCAALETLLGKDFAGGLNDSRLQNLKKHLDALAAAEQASQTAASALLDSRDALKMLELRHASNPHYTALYQARLAGLRSEAEIQLTLNQLSPEEHRWVQALLDAPTAPRNADVAVARLTLSTTEGDGGTQSEELDGVLLITHPSVLRGVARHSLLLYWPGRFGGLQHFASRRALEQALFKLSANDEVLALHLSELSGDPFEYALQNQLYRCVQQATRLIADNPVPAKTQQRTVALEKLREHTLPRLTVPMPAARELAFAQLLEQNHSSVLAKALPQWLGTLSDARRSQFKHLFKTYIAAMKRSHELLERDLPPRDDFSKKRIDTRLRKDFALKQDFEVMLDLPDSTTWQKVITDGAAPGTPQKNVLITSKNRSKLSLADLAQTNIDQELWWRLSLMQVEISTDDEAERQKLKTGITQPYLRKLITELDLAGHYETQIRHAFLGAPTASAFDLEYRRESLTEPWRQMLKLQGEFALLQQQIDAHGRQVLNIAIDANTSQAFAAQGTRIVLLPAHLTVGGEDTPHQGPSTLSGVTFIEEQVSGLTLLYLPDSPDGIHLRQYDTLEQARQSLFNLCLHNSMVNYLAGRALQGDFALHVSRINQALLRNFNALIGVGMAWPATTSLAAHLLNVHMGRLLEAHRSTSRSNDALYLEHCALKSGAMFNYLKMAFGMVPFVGSAIALYDAWGSANLAVAAFLRGDVGHGLAEVEAVLLSLIDAAMDVLPGANAAPGAARAITRHRQLRTVARKSGALQMPSRQQARRVRDYFYGYEYEHEISLADLQPATHGIYRNVYRHAEGDFMISQGRIYRIELSDAPRGWRLHGTRARAYKQPIALDETGNWNTHYAVYGTLMEGGGVGGGAVLGHLADGMDPLWPAVIRRWLPRWWADRTQRRLGTLRHTIDAGTRQLNTQSKKTKIDIEEYYKTDAKQRIKLQPSVDAACAKDIEIAQNQYANLEELRSLGGRRQAREIAEVKNKCAFLVVDRTLCRIDLANQRLQGCLDRIDDFNELSNTTPASDIRKHLDLMAQRTAVRKAFLQDLEYAYTATEQANLWNGRITLKNQKLEMADDLANVNKAFTGTSYRYLKAAHSLEIITRYDAVHDQSWLYFHVQLKNARIKVDRAMVTQHNLPTVHANVTQRHRVLKDCLETYSRFRRDLNAWVLGYPQHLDKEQVTRFLDNLANLETSAQKVLGNRASTSPNEVASGKKFFETEDNQLLIGVEKTDAVTQQKRFTIEGVDGHTETWLPRSSGKYHLSEQSVAVQRPQQTDVRPLLAESRTRLAAIENYQSKVKGYADQGMLPVDLEHMMNSEADELIMRARDIEGLSPTDPIIVQLKEKARDLARAGRTLRIEQSMNSKTPTEGYLDYLLEQRVVDIRKEGALRDIGKRPDGRRDFLQEYEVRDLTRQPPQTLWYAHFHYSSAKSPFNDFVKGHLKLPEQRNLGLQWQQAQASSGAQVESIWRGDIGKPLALKHFPLL
ncbi:dermonecrotic toxin domain-containing protein [Pseudomonas farris]